jgi:hypothetical protein
MVRSATVTTRAVCLLYTFVKASLRPYAITPQKCGMMLGQHHMVGFKVLQNFYASCGESVQLLQS